MAVFTEDWSGFALSDDILTAAGTDWLVLPVNSNTIQPAPTGVPAPCIVTAGGPTATNRFVRVGFQGSPVVDALRGIVWDVFNLGVAHPAAGTGPTAMETLTLIRHTDGVQMQGAVVFGKQTGGTGDWTLRGVLNRNNTTDIRSFDQWTDAITALPHGLTLSTTDWYWLRGQVNADGTQRGRLWLYGSEEPAAWVALGSRVDTFVDMVPGLGSAWPANRYYDLAYISVGTDGDTAPMPATFSTDFSEYALGDLTTQGWTNRYLAKTYTVTDRVGSLSGRVVAEVASAGDGQRLLSWDTVGATHQDVDVVAALRPAFFHAGDWSFGLGVRGSGGIGTETYTVGAVRTATEWGVYRTLNSTYLDQAGGAFTHTLDVLHYIRWRVTGDAWWYAISTDPANIALDGAGVPVGGWTANGTGLAAGTVQAGWVGISTYRGSTYGDWEWFSVGVNGAYAEMPSAAAPPWTLTTNVVGNGSVTKNPDTADYSDQAVVELTAVADPGWSFDSWSGALTGIVNPQSVTMDADKTVTATFTEDTGVGTPSNVVVTVTSRTSATVTWDDVVAADVFQVEARVRAGTT